MVRIGIFGSRWLFGWLTAIRWGPRAKADNASADNASADNASAADNADDDEAEPVNAITVTPDSSVFRQTRTIQQSSRSNKPLKIFIPIEFKVDNKQYTGRVLFRVLNSRYLYAVAPTEPGIEKAFLLRAKDFKKERDLLDPYESTTAQHLELFNWFIMNTVAMITQSNGQVLVLAEGTFDNTNIVCVTIIFCFGKQVVLSISSEEGSRKTRGAKAAKSKRKKVEIERG